MEVPYWLASTALVAVGRKQTALAVLRTSADYLRTNGDQLGS
jgi:hypothetical protein